MRWTAAMAALKGLMVWYGEPKKRAYGVFSKGMQENMILIQTT